MKAFDENRDFLLNQLDNPAWIASSGLDSAELDALAWNIVQQESSRMMVRAKVISLVLTKARISVDQRCAFAQTIDHHNLLLKIRDVWRKEIDANEMRVLVENGRDAAKTNAFDGNVDFGHIAPDWENMLKLGFPGLLAHVRACRYPEASEFYDACEMVLEAILAYLKRLAEASEQQGMSDTAQRLYALTEHAPETLAQAYQMIDIVYMLLTHIEGENLRSLGRLDCLLNRLFASDLASGCAKNELVEYTKQFFAVLRAYKFSANVPFTLGGVNPDGSDSTNDFSYFLIDVYREMNIHDPKMQIRVAKSTPKPFLRKILSCIRAGMNSFVFINDKVGIPAMENLGASLAEARDYLLIGCYEPALCGLEMPCTLNGRINIAKVVLAAMNDGVDPQTGIKVGTSTGNPETFEQLMSAVEQQFAYFADRSIEISNAYEKLYSRLNPAPVLSSFFPYSCVQNGIDCYAGGAKYNNSSINVIGLGTAADSLAAIRKFVYEDHVLTLPQLCDILKSDWKDQELLRMRMLRHAPKYGNADPSVDALATTLSEFGNRYINSRANNRGGRYRAGLVSINWNIEMGALTGATPDGRRNGEPLSKNVGAGIGRDKAGVTALMQSVAAVDYTLQPNGSVLDLTLHPTTVQGEEGLNTLESMLDTYCALGCFGVHINIFDAALLKDAQKNPEKYESLQVRVCGWNSYFINLNETEQNQFILQAEAL